MVSGIWISPIYSEHMHLLQAVSKPGTSVRLRAECATVRTLQRC